MDEVRGDKNKYNRTLLQYSTTISVINHRFNSSNNDKNLHKFIHWLIYQLSSSFIRCFTEQH